MIRKVVTPCGEILGESTDYGAVFRGIRYAEAKRFALPREITAWKGEYHALEFGACCPQRRAYEDESQSKKPFYHHEFREGVSFRYDEDCLFLNIYSPMKTEGCPVVIFIHGGNFMKGSGDEKPFDGEAYCRRGIIFVSLNYRLNIFGFYADRERCQGNLGLYDQVCAIDWVRRNIAAFGGDPDNITLMGQSAGAMSVQSLLSSPRCMGKIRRAIMLSGGGVRRWMLPERKPNIRFWESVIKKSGARSFEEFESLSAKEVFYAWQNSHPLAAQFATAPMIDEKLLPKNRAVNTVPCILGMVQKDIFPRELFAMAKRFAKRCATKGTPCYIYRFCHNLPGDTKGTFHSADLWYALGSLKCGWRPFDDEDKKLSDEMLDRFVAFMRTDRPEISGAKAWAPYRKKKDLMIFK